VTPSIEVIARALILKDGQALLAHKKTAWNTFLPGGHVEYGESAAVALSRELEEELGVAVRVARFLGAVEHAWDDADSRGHEVNLVFAVDAPSLSPAVIAPSREAHLEFLWQPLTALAARRLEPAVLCEVLPHWAARGYGEGWASTMAR